MNSLEACFIFRNSLKFYLIFNRKYFHQAINYDMTIFYSINTDKLLIKRKNKTQVLKCDRNLKQSVNCIQNLQKEVSDLLLSILTIIPISQAFREEQENRIDFNAFPVRDFFLSFFFIASEKKNPQLNNHTLNSKTSCIYNHNYKMEI